MEQLSKSYPGKSGAAPGRLLVGIDVGGTFTDFVIFDPAKGSLETFKVLSTPDDPSLSVLRGLEEIRAKHNQYEFWVVHGTTVATNALLERKGARTALITTAGFRDLLHIGRQNRPALYDLFAKPEDPLAERSLTFEAHERVDQHGHVLQPLSQAEAEFLAEQVQSSGAQSAAVCLLFSFANSAHERMLGAALRRRNIPASLSSEILPEFREYERASTTAVNAYVTPILDAYLSRLENAVRDRGGVKSMRVMQSNGGTMRLAEARRHGVRCILSGPAGGVVGAQYAALMAAEAAGEARALKLITFDMGGTSTDVALIDGEAGLTSESLVGGCPIRIPVIDIHTIGAGGGSIARADQGGALRVGPESAGANPGPACYGRSSGRLLATVTDANVLLGRIRASEFLGGSMPLDTAAAREAVALVGAGLNLDVIQTASGIVEVVNAHMERALRVISVERGHDPEAFTLLSFGGAGGLHAAELARQMGIRRLLAPLMASTLSALGMLAADIVRDGSLTVMLPGDTHAETLRQRLEPLAQAAVQALLEDGVRQEEILLLPQADLRYKGQSYELTIPFSASLVEQFHVAHEHAYGYQRPEAAVEIVNLRLRAVGKVQKPRLPQLGHNPGMPEAAPEIQPVHLAGGTRAVPVYRWLELAPGAILHGPALVVRPDTTLLLAQGDRAILDAFGNLVADIAPLAESAI